MCLWLTIRVPDIAENEARDMASALEGATALEVTLGHRGWPWRRAVVFRLSEEGGCACSLLADDANWTADTWSMTPEAAERVASTLEAFGRAAKRPMVVEALWQGESVRETVDLPLARLTELAAESRLGTGTSYRVEME